MVICKVGQWRQIKAYKAKIKAKGWEQEMRIPVIAGNWKMYKLRGEAESFIQELSRQIAPAAGLDSVPGSALSGAKSNAEPGPAAASGSDPVRTQTSGPEPSVSALGLKPEIVICPPFTALESAVRSARGTEIRIGAQHVFWETEGAYTGEVSPEMLRDLGCQYVICGHSERRQYFGETDEMVNRRLKAVLKAGMTPIFCLGETLTERENGVTFAVCQRQLEQGLDGLSAEQAARLVVAYEPVWAIGTGRTATPEDAEDVISFIRAQLSNSFGPAVGEQVRIQYGGSVKPENIKELMAQPNIDGVLVGGASLQADSFAKIVNWQA